MKLHGIYGANLRDLINKANEQGVTKDEIIKILKLYADQFVLIYYR
jgi:DNA-binding transcriptional regulator YhcF (GntR family)